MRIEFLYTETQGQRLFSARWAAGFRHADDAIIALGLDATMYRAHERGQIALQLESATAYASAFGVNRAWLFFGDGQPSLEPAPVLPAELLQALTKLIDERIEAALQQPARDFRRGN